MKWKQVSTEEAKDHPLYGVKGWLLAILILMALGALNTFVSLFSYPTMHNMYGAYAPVLMILNIVFGLIFAAVAYTGFVKDYRFQAYVLSILYVGMAVGVVNTIAFMIIPPEFGGRLFAFFSGFLGVAECALLIWYFKVSKRVNITYFNRIPVRE